MKKRRAKRARAPRKARGVRKPAAGDKKPKRAVPAKPVQIERPRNEGEAAGPPGPTLRSQSQLEIPRGHRARPLTAIEQAARLASARMERRIGRLLSRRVKLKFR